jgi:hypothetical protein
MDMLELIANMTDDELLLLWHRMRNALRKDYYREMKGVTQDAIYSEKFQDDIYSEKFQEDVMGTCVTEEEKA